MSKKYPLLDDREWLTQKYETEKLCGESISKIVGCGRTTIYPALEKAGISRRPSAEALIHPDKRLHDKDWLYQKYEIERLSSVDIAEIIGVGSEAVMNALRRLNIETRIRTSKSTYPLLNNKQWVLQKYQIEQLSALKISVIVGCSISAVYKSLRRFDIPKRTFSDAASLKEWVYPKLNDRDWLYQKYWIERKSGRGIAKELGCDRTVVLWALKRNNIPRRSISEANRGKKVSKSSRKKQSDTRRRLQKDPEFAKRMFKATAKRPTKPERKYQEIVDNNSLPFKYTGDGEIVIGNKCPDFIHLTEKIVVEVFGKAYHAPLFTFLKTMRYHQTYKGTIAHYKKHKYKCVIFWDTDLVERADAEQYVLSVLREEGIIK